ncbi:MAG: hypothetical protein ACRDA3_02665 [Peptostreptococcaceae bacterium]
MSEQIGIIVMNYDEKLFLCEEGYFIKSSTGETDNVEKVIKREIRYFFNIDMFRIVKTFEEKLIDLDGIRTMYLVEVGIYTKDFEFIDPYKMVKDILNTNYKEYLERNLLKYEDNNSLASTILNISFLFITVDIIPKFIIKNGEMLFLPILGFLGSVYFIAHIFLKPKLINKLLKFNINTTIAIVTLNTLMTLYGIKLFLVAKHLINI